MAIAMTVLTAAMLWPQVRGLSLLPTHGDPLFSVWRIAWVAHQLRHDPLHLYDANIYWPERNTLSNSDGMPLTGAVAAPLLWAGAPPVIVYNLFLLASFVLSGVSMFLLARRLTGDPRASAVAGVAFAFYPWRFEHYVHLELQSAFWMPLALLALHRLLEEPHRWRRGVWLGVLIGAQYLSSLYFGIFLATFVAVVGAALMLLRPAQPRPWRPLALAAVVTVALVAPTVPPYLSVRDTTGSRGIEEVEMHSARLSDYLTVRQPPKPFGEVNERQVFPGVAVMGLAALALLTGVNRARWAYLAGLAVAIDISLGSHGLLQPILFKWVLPYQGLRAPARFTMLAGFSLCVLGALGLSRALQWLRAPIAWLAGAAVAGLLVVESWPALDLKPVANVHPIYRHLAGEEHARLAILPMWYPAGPRYLLDSTTHWLPMVNGYSGSVPPSYREIHFAMREFPDARSMSLLRERGVTHLVVHEEFLGAEEYRALLDRMEATPGIDFVTLATDGVFEARIYTLK